MKKTIILLLQVLFILPTLAQNTNQTSNLNVTRQGFGWHSGIDMSMGFVNAKPLTEGSSYYFDNWETEGTIFIKDKGRVKLEKVNINLYDNKLEAIYNENSVFTFDSQNLIRIVINGKVFRTFEFKGETKIFEQIFNNKLSIYRYYNVRYTEASTNPMINRKTNKFTKRAIYYLYNKENGKLTTMKMTKKSISKHLQSDSVSEKSILDFIKQHNLSMNNETDLIKIFEFASK